MGLRTEQEYRAGLRDGRRVFYLGERVTDLLAEPELALAVEHSAHCFSIAVDRPDLVPIVAGMLGAGTVALTVADVRERFGHTPRESTALGYGPFHSGGEAYVIAEPVVDGDPA